MGTAVSHGPLPLSFTAEHQENSSKIIHNHAANTIEMLSFFRHHITGLGKISDGHHQL